MDGSSVQQLFETSGMVSLPERTSSLTNRPIVLECVGLRTLGFQDEESPLWGIPKGALGL